MDGEEADATRRAGGDGSDTLAGGAGGDGLNGGAGFDMASYAGSDARVTVNLAAGPASGGEATGDAFTDIEGLIGSPHSDALSGNAGSNLLNGGLGSDVLTGGLGRDAFDFAAALGAANVDQITDFSVTMTPSGSTTPFSPPSPARAYFSPLPSRPMIGSFTTAPVAFVLRRGRRGRDCTGAVRDPVSRPAGVTSADFDVT